ncbi:rhodanese-like domain-containing protein [Bacillaceae bacterium IKA-2]|nr:rhodanese-like domain-containing protein [Bacillaceae bacterium IKA-2]
MKYRLKFLLIVMLGLIFSACSNDASNLTTNDPDEKAQQEEVQNDRLSSEAEVEFLTEKLKQFYTAYPEGRYLVKAADVKDVLDNFFILDVRFPEEFVQGHLPNSVNIPRKDISERLKEIPKNSQILVVCGTGESAAQAATALNFSGYNAVSLSGGFRGWNASIEGVNQLPVYELEARLKSSEQTNDGAVYIDVREPDEYQAGHIDGFINYPLSTLKDRYAELPTDKEIIVICRTVNRSMQAAGFLLEKDFEAVTNVSGNEGGMAGWNGTLVE